MTLTGVWVTALALSPWQAAPPQFDTPLIPGDTVLATPFGRYEAGRLHRWIMGDGYRDLWGLALRAPVLDPERFGGGLTVERTGGGLQTRSLVFQGGDGREWRFRSIDKDAARTLDPELRRTIAARVVQDQIAHLFPLSAALAHPILAAADVLHATPTLVVLPDHPALGEYRDEFRGMVGWMEVRPDEGDGEVPGFFESPRVVSSERMLERIEEERGNRLDALVYLRARLVDALLGDWDRHPDQWRWAGFERDGHLVFQPVPRDRDWAFSKLDGLVSRFTWIQWPNYVGFRTELPSAFRLMWSGRALDRRLLSGLDRADFESEARGLIERIDDRVIAEAVRGIPAGYPAATLEFLATALRNRRDDLLRFAAEFYEMLAESVDLWATDADEVVQATWLPDGSLRVEVSVADGTPGRAPLISRTFLPTETHDVRLRLRGGDDVVVVEGPGGSPITLRVLGGGGDDRVVHRSRGDRVRVYDHRGDNEVESAVVTIDRSNWTDPVDPDRNTHRVGTRDWGSRTLALPVLGYDSDLGLLTGVRVERRGFGFRHAPYRTRLTGTVAWATGTGRPDVVLEAALPVGEHPHLRIEGRARLFGTDPHRFYGFGNGSAADDPRGREAFQAPRDLLGADGRLVWRPRGGWHASLGGSLRSHRPRPAGETVLVTEAPYGSGRFDEWVAEIGVGFDRVESVGVAGRGLAAEIAVELAPGWLDVEESYGAVEGRVEWRASAGDDVPLRPGLALVAGGRRLMGRFPYQAAAYLGGPATLRGAPSERWAGRGAVHLNLEGRIFLTELVFVLPGDLGLLAMADVGRVFSDVPEPSRWHRGLGGGVWLSFLDAFRVAATVAKGEEDTLVYLTLGLPF